MNCAQLTGAEELLDRSRNRLGVDQVVRHQIVCLSLIQAFLDGTLHAHKTGTELVFGQLTNGAHTAIPKMINIVHFTAAIAKLDQNA
jgi:hypothetical protein